ncbi:MAG: response regulator transcription factor [Pseudonocardia sp.]|nr:response regulator transcription factor [Pseudonocardia sp.]
MGALERRGAQTHRAMPNGLTWALIHEADVMLLDPCLSYEEAIAICREVRSTFDIPIVIISDRTQRADRIGGLRAGADHYVERPYHLDELIAKIVAATRPRGRTVDRTPGRPKKNRVGDIEIDFERMKVTVAGVDTELTKKEFQLLVVIFGEEGGVCSREKLATDVWGRPEEEVYDSIQVLMSRLRAKLGRERIKTVRSVGYRVVAPSQTTDNLAATNGCPTSGPAR